MDLIATVISMEDLKQIGLIALIFVGCWLGKKLWKFFGPILKLIGLNPWR